MNAGEVPAKMISDMANVKIGLTGRSATEIVAYAQGIHDGLDGNAAFATPVPPLVDGQTAINDLAAANGAWLLNGGRAELLAREQAEAKVREVVRSWAAYVQLTSLGDAELIRSTGFETVRRGSPIGELPPPRNLMARLTNMTGRASLVWDREDGAEMHHVYMSTSSDPFNWVLIGATTKSRFNADSLEPGRFYWFAVTALGAAGESSKSDVLRVMAAA